LPHGTARERHSAHERNRASISTLLLHRRSQRRTAGAADGRLSSACHQCCGRQYNKCPKMCVQQRLCKARARPAQTGMASLMASTSTRIACSADPLTLDLRRHCYLAWLGDAHGPAGCCLSNTVQSRPCYILSGGQLTTPTLADFLSQRRLVPPFVG
jgi:hypothetical protein